MSDGKSGLQLRSLLRKSGELELSLVNIPTPEPGPDEIVVRVEATPINPVRPRASDRSRRYVDRKGVGNQRASGGHREGAGSCDEGEWPRGSISRCRSAMKAPAW